MVDGEKERSQDRTSENFSSPPYRQADLPSDIDLTTEQGCVAAHVLTVRQGEAWQWQHDDRVDFRLLERLTGCKWGGGGFSLLGSGKARSGPVPVHGKSFSILDFADHRVNLRS